MGAVGIIAEFNPLHTGHKKLIDFAKSKGETLICTLSGNFVQRGDTALFPKIKRAESALLAGIDIVLEMPVLWSMSTAQNFALCGVWQLYNAGCEIIVFGSELGEIEPLEKAADILLSDEFFSLVTSKMKSGITYAAARQEPAEELGALKDVLSFPNNNLGIEYIVAAKKLGLTFKFDTLKRTGSGHDSAEPSGTFVSSAFVRDKIKSGNIGYGERFIPLEIRRIISPEYVSDIKRIESAVLGILRLKKKEDFLSLPDLSEGIENKLYFSIQVAKSLDELYESVKSKRYTLARVRRLVLSAALSFDKKFFMTPPPYIRMLGFSSKGEAHIKKSTSLVPIAAKISDIKALGKDAEEIFATECRATDLYALSLESPQECGMEYKYKFLKTE